MADLTPNIVAAWHLNSASGIVAFDASPNNNNGALQNMEDVDWVVGKLNNCLQFDGVNEWVNCGNIANFERTDSFSLEVWTKISVLGAKVILSRQQSVNPWRGWTLFCIDGKFVMNIAHNGIGGDYLHVQTNNTFNDNNWHHLVVTYNGSSLGAGIIIYVDGNLVPKTIVTDNLTGSIITSVNCQISGRGGTDLVYNGSIDEAVIYDKELSLPEVQQRWNGGTGTESYGQAPPTLSNPNPNNGATGVVYDQNLDWDSNGIKFDIYFGTSSPPPLVESNCPSSDWTIPYNLDSCTKYYWQIKARNFWGDETVGAEWDFTSKNEPPVMPHTPTPVHGATGQNLNVTLSWDSEDYNPNDSLVYDIYFGTSSNPPLKKSNHGSKSYGVSGLDLEKRYYWKITAKDDASCGVHNITSPVWNFKTKAMATSGKKSFDPRKAYRETLGIYWDIEDDGDLEYCITIEDNDGEKVYIPMYLSEEVKSEELPSLPFLELEIPPGHTTYKPQDILAATRKVESLVLIHIYFTDTDNIDRTEFAKKIKDKIQDLTRYYQSSAAGITFMNIEDDGLEEETDSAHRVVFHYIATLYCLYYDICVEP